MANLKQASHELFQRKADEHFATLADLWQRCHDLKERLKDRWELPLQIVPTSESGELKMVVGSDGAFALNDWAFGQVCTMARVQKGTLNRLAPATAAQVLRETLSKAEGDVVHAGRFPFEPCHGSFSPRLERSFATSVRTATQPQYTPSTAPDLPRICRGKKKGPRGNSLSPCAH